MASGQESSTGAAARQLREMWECKTGDRLGPAWDPAFHGWIKKNGFPLVADALQRVAAPRYENGERVSPNVTNIPRYVIVLQADEDEPGMLECYLVRGLMRKKFYCQERDDEILTLLRRALRAGVTESEMRNAVDDNDVLEDCFAVLGIDRTEFRIAMGHPIFDQPAKRLVFIRETDPEWRLWDDYLRRTTGKGAPMNKHFGWYFPTRIPPLDGSPKRRRG